MGEQGGKPAAKGRGQIETELRLAGEPDVLRAVFTSPLMTAAADGQDETVADLENRYFDTLDRQLRAKGLALRLRANGSGFKQTLKAGDNAKAALLKRDEWETVLDGDQLELDAFPKAALKLLPKAARKGGLQPAFTTWVQRRIRQVTLDGEDRPTSRIEAALDLGKIETGAGTLPVAEIELELIEGSPEDLYRLALDLHEIGPLHLETRSKSTRAFDKLVDQPPHWHRARTPLLGRSDTVDDAMAAIFESCFEQWLANQAATMDGRHPEGVHQMRVGLRRLRSAFSMFRKFIPTSQADWLRGGAKEAIGALGPARDWDVFQSELLLPVIRARPDDRELGILKARARTRGRASYRAARKMLAGADYTRFALRFGEWLEERAWRTGDDAKWPKRRAKPIAVFAMHLLNKRYKRVLAKGEALAGLPVEQRHELRIALKKLRYAVEFFEPLFDKKTVKPFLGSVKALQDDLGHLNDVAVAETLLGELLARPGKQDVRHAAGLVIGWHARGVSAIEPGMLRDWNAFADRPTFWT